MFIRNAYYTEVLTSLLFSEALLAGEISGWYAPPAIYLFPGHLLYFFFHVLFSSNVTWTMVANAFVLGVIGVWGWIYFAQSVTNCRSQVTCAILIFAGIVNLFLLNNEFIQVIMLVTPVSHGGTFALLPYCLRLFWDLSEKNFKPDIRMFLAGLLIIAVTVSDPIFYAWFYAPCGIFLLMRWNFGLLKRGMLFLVFCTMVALLLRQVISEFIYGGIFGFDGYIPNFIWFGLETLLYIFVESLGDYVTFHIADNVESISPMNYFSLWMGHSSLSFIFWCLCLLALFAFALKIVKNKKIYDSARLILPVVIVVGLFPLLRGDFVLRYEIPFLFVPLFAVPIFFTAIFADKWFSKPRINQVFTGVVALSALAIGSPDKDAVDAVISYYPPQQGCLDEQAKRYGLKRTGDLLGPYSGTSVFPKAAFNFLPLIKILK